MKLMPKIFWTVAVSVYFLINVYVVYDVVMHPDVTEHQVSDK
jgi:hypothetical protein